MTKRIFFSIVAVALATLLVSMGVVLGLMYRYLTQVQRQQLKNQTILAAQAAANEGLEYFQGLQVPDCRITWVAADGTVLYDDQADSHQMENHLEREEIQEALATGYGESDRQSSTLTQRYLYCAQRLPDGTVLRLASPQSTVTDLLLPLGAPSLILLVVALALSGLLAARLSQSIVQPLNQLDLEAPMAVESYPELSPLLRRLDRQQRQLRLQAQDMAQRKNEFDTVTASMSEGLILLNSACRILTLNPAAQKILGLRPESIGTDRLSYDRDLGFQSLLLQALGGRRAQTTIVLPSGEYEVDASPVEQSGSVTGVVLLLFDVSERRRSEQLRREFTANVSHELKTPLHAIGGYAELMAQGIVQPQDVAPFARKIQTETDRMVHLVEDIIRLSRLDEGMDRTVFEDIDLYAKAQEVTATLTGYAKAADVTLTLEGEPVTVSGTQDTVGGIVTNLCDNAIKYNRPGGCVTVRVGTRDGRPFLSVADTGIGIQQEHLDRIFERFYRVDKSHSKEVGGTGLGLSIVKHAAQILEAQIQVDSTPGQGTTITVTFP